MNIETEIEAKHEGGPNNFQGIPEYFTTKQAAAYLGVSRQKLEIGRTTGVGPIYCRPMDSRLIRYLRSDLDDWMQCNRQQHTGKEIR